MSLLYPNPCYNEVCYIWSCFVLYYASDIELYMIGSLKFDVFPIEKK